MIKFYKILFMTTLMIGTFISISAYSWLSMWMGLEINLLSIIPLLKDSKFSLFSSEATIKYFITQALASSILLLSLILMLNIKEILNFEMNSMKLLMNSALLMKLGAAPFHSWFPEVMEGLSWNNCLLMLTWQKIAPMILIFYNINISLFFLFIILSSTLIGSIMGLNQISLRKILTYSSITHISWMLASMLSSMMIWFIYFSIYILITLNIIHIFNFMNIYYLPQLINSLTFNKPLYFFFSLNFLNFGGLPPFLGFLPKWLVINSLLQTNFFYLSILLIILTLITLFFYLRITFSALMMNFNESLIFNYKILKNKFLFFNFINLSSLILCSMLSIFMT